MSDDQADFRRSLRGFLAKASPESEVRRLMEAPIGFEPAVWQRMADELGLPGVAIPEAYGGQGFGGTELRLVIEELGRVLYGGPYLATVALGAELLLRLDDEQARADLLPRIADGSLRAAVSLGGDLRARAVVTVEGDEPRLPVTLDSTLGEVLADPKAAAVLAEVLAPMARMGDSSALGMDMERMMASIPLGRLTSFGPVGRDQLESLIARVNQQE